MRVSSFCKKAIRTLNRKSRRIFLIHFIKNIFKTQKNSTTLYSLIILFKINNLHRLGYRKQKTIRLQIFWKNNLRPEFGFNGPKTGLKSRFLLFAWIWIIFFLEIAHNDSLQQCLTSARGKICEKKIGVQIWGKLTKIVPEIRFYSIFWSLAH